MNIITPNTYQKLRITMPTELTSKGEAPATINKPFDEYTLFLLLEQERNQALKEVYRKRGVPALVHDDEVASRIECTGLPSFPPRYQNLHYSLEWFVSRLNNPRRPIPTKSTAQSWKTLDQMSIAFLKDVSAILRDRYSKDHRAECHTPIGTPTFRRLMTITPVPSPPRQPADGLEALLLASEMAFPPLPFLDNANDSRQPSVCQDVDLSDRDIREMWTSESGVEVNVAE
jgi:hypothetical protein